MAKKNRCRITNTFCEFADKNGECLQPDIALEMKCHEKITYEQIVEAWAKYITGTLPPKDFNYMLDNADAEQLALALVFLAGYFSNSKEKVAHLTSLTRKEQ